MGSVSTVGLMVEIILVIQGRPKHGQGTLIVSDVFEYKGEFSEDKMEGVGSIISNNGEIYSGQWFDSQKHGQDTYVWPDGKEFKGEW